MLRAAAVQGLGDVIEGSITSATVGPGQAESGNRRPVNLGVIMVMKWELTKTALWFGSALISVYVVVSVLELMARHH